MNQPCLQQCLTALVDNALLYSPAPGVPMEEREAIFGRFVRGSGIGLSVVQLLIEAMGGRLQVADHPGGGADFQLVLPGLANP